jgi:GR25 family glycosyltransferase involved in LPS biosynthesis
MNYQLVTAFIFALSLLNNFGYAEIKDHLKKVENKSDCHSIKNIDFIYLINLDQRPEKLQRCLDQLEPYGIFPYRFSAVKGWELDFETINDLGVKLDPRRRYHSLTTTFLPNGEMYRGAMTDPKKTYFYQAMTRGALGCFLSHLSILKDAYDSGYETIWVMEDDILVLKNPYEVSDAIENIDRIVGKDKWDILFTDKDSKDRNNKINISFYYFARPNYTPGNPYRPKERKKIAKDLRTIGARFGAYSMILRRSGIKKILDFVYEYKIFVPYDDEWQNIPDLKMFTVLDDIVTTIHDAPSDSSKNDGLLTHSN